MSCNHIVCRMLILIVQSCHCIDSLLTVSIVMAGVAGMIRDLLQDVPNQTQAVFEISVQRLRCFVRLAWPDY